VARTDVWFEIPPIRDDYQLTLVDGSYLTAAVKPKQFLHIDEVVDENECTRCALCVDRCPTGVISLGKFEGSLADGGDQRAVEAPWEIDSGQRDHKNGYAYGMRL